MSKTKTIKIKIPRLDRFLINYNGNKYNETKKYLIPLIPDINKYDLICEPYCGIFGFSRALMENNLNNFKGEIWLNDYDETVINMLKQVRDFTEEDIKKYLALIDTYETNEKLTQDKQKPLILARICQTINIHLMGKDKGKTKLNNYHQKFNEYKLFFNKVKFFNLIDSDFLKLIKDSGKKALIFFDPPYFNSSNKGYHKLNFNYNELEYQDGTTLYLNIFEMFKHDDKNTLIFIMNRLDIINYVFKEYLIKEIKYIKSVSVSKTSF
jgi:site-specific DNA-adenine methylase